MCVCVRCILRQTADGFHYISGRVRCKTCENSDIALPSPPISKSVHRRDRMVGRASERAMRADSYRASFGWDFPPCRALAANFEQKTFTRILTVYELWLGNKQKRKIFEYVYLEEQKCVLICYSRWSTGACVSVSTLSRLRWNRDTDFPLDFECQRNGSTTRPPLSFSLLPNNLRTEVRTPNPMQHRSTTTTPLCSNFSGVECVAYVGNSTVVVRRARLPPSPDSPE